MASKLLKLRRLLLPAVCKAKAARNNPKPTRFTTWFAHKNYSTATQSPPQSNTKDIRVTFAFPDGTKQDVFGKEGDTLLDLVIDNDVDIDGYGACEGTLACSTCHVVLSDANFARLDEEPTDEELDMLDMAFGLTDTSRLGCQIVLNKSLNGLEVEVPDNVLDARTEP